MVKEQNIRKVIEMISNEDNYFNMSTWDNYAGFTAGATYPENICGTPACIGGWAEAIIKYEKKTKEVDTKQIIEWLGIGEVAAEDLFYSVDAVKATRKEAIAHLESIIETGVVDWPKFSRSGND